MIADTLECTTLTIAGLSPQMQLASKQDNERLRTVAVIGSWVLLFLICIFSYFPGLQGPFVFDDFGSIAALGDFGGVRDWETFKAFVFGGLAGPTGRPLALLTFLLDATNWPADPWPFKRTNLIIHLFSAALLGALIARILNLLDFDRQDARWIALISAGCWLLHPFLVSTTLYAVQRMAQLSTLFVFAGLLSHLCCRSLIATNARRAYACMSLSVVLFTLLAMISKENGILLPLLIGVVEITVFSSQQPRPTALNRYWSFAFIILPSVLVMAYLGRYFFNENFFKIVPPRDFSIYERLLTEPRVLVDYLRHWIVPELYTAGVFQDHFTKSTGMLSPITTLLSVLMHVSVISLALIKRRKWPLFALATLFFYASHSLESSVLNLELYFEHRNYLAAAFLFVPLIVLLHKNVGRTVFFAAAACALLVLAGFTRYSATVWKDYPSMVEASARKAPTSARAQSQYATNLHNEKRYEESIQVIDSAIARTPNNASLLITRSTILCNIGVLSDSDFEESAGILSAEVYDPRLIEQYTTFSTLVADRQCPNVSMDSLRTLFLNMLLVPNNSDPQSLQYSQIKYFIGLVEVRAGSPAKAVAAFEESLQARPGASHAMHMAALMASNNYAQEALYLSGMALQQLEQKGPGILSDTFISESDIRAFRATVKADLDAERDEDHDGHPASE